MSHTKLTLNHDSEVLWINTEFYLKHNAKRKVPVQAMKAYGIAEVSLQQFLTIWRLTTTLMAVPHR